MQHLYYSNARMNNNKISKIIPVVYNTAARTHSTTSRKTGPNNKFSHHSEATLTQLCTTRALQIA